MASRLNFAATRGVELFHLPPCGFQLLCSQNMLAVRNRLAIRNMLCPKPFQAAMFIHACFSRLIDRIDFDRIDFDRIDFDRIDFDRIYRA
jgi:hypothetical protein